MRGPPKPDAIEDHLTVTKSHGVITALNGLLMRVAAPSSRLVAHNHHDTTAPLQL